EETMRPALAAMEDGASERKAAKELGISRTTLQSYCLGSLSTSARYHYKQWLLPQQETALSE
ncbi:hypothetical protein C7212DRAFT_161701, partial [Tuber magnatum]